MGRLVSPESVRRNRWLILGLVLLASGCTTTQTASPSPTLEVEGSPVVTPTQEIPYFPIPTSYVCDESLILDWPVLDSVIPIPAEPGSTLQLAGHGGAIRCGNAYDESSRDFDVYLDDERVGSINCYVNHCEGTIDLPQDLEKGTYILSIGPEDEYELEVQ
jgi:hypothetical protein